MQQLPSIRFALLTTASIAIMLACGGAATKDTPSSIEEATAMCAEEHPGGCLYLAKRFQEDPEPRKTYPEAYEVYNEVSCGMDLPNPCYEIGFIRLTGEGGRKDVKEAATFLQKSCDLGLARGCHTAGVQMRRGDGVDKDGPRAFELFKKACEGRVFEGCADAGQIRTTDEAGPADFDEAKSWYAKACKVDPKHPFCDNK